jgi:protein gp37
VNKSRIEWTDYTWNPIKGLCPVGCWYCYARKIYKRFHMSEALEFSVTRGDIAKMDRLPPSRIFICSTMEMFHPAVEKEWLDKIFYTIGQFPKHTFIVLTKMPERIDRPMPDNAWLGVSVTGAAGDDDRVRLLCLNDHPARVKLVSFEPLMEDVAVKGWNAFPDYADALSWVVVGRMTGHGHKHDPSQANLRRIYSECRQAGLPIFFKNNLRGIWKGPFVQELPTECCV